MENVDLSGIQNTVYQVAATVLALLLVVRMLTAYGKRNWGEMMVEVVAVLFLGYFIWTPEAAIGSLQAISGSIFG